MNHFQLLLTDHFEAMFACDEQERQQQEINTALCLVFYKGFPLRSARVSSYMQDPL